MTWNLPRARSRSAINGPNCHARVPQEDAQGTSTAPAAAVKPEEQPVEPASTLEDLAERPVSMPSFPSDWRLHCIRTAAENAISICRKAVSVGGRVPRGLPLDQYEAVLRAQVELGNMCALLRDLEGYLIDMGNGAQRGREGREAQGKHASSADQPPVVALSSGRPAVPGPFGGAGVRGVPEAWRPRRPPGAGGQGHRPGARCVDSLLGLLALAGWLWLGVGVALCSAGMRSGGPPALLF